VTCKVDNIASASTTVQVVEEDGTIRIRNDDEELSLRAVFSKGPQSVSPITVGPGGSASRKVRAGTYTVQIQFDFEGFFTCTTDTIKVDAGQTVTRGYDSSPCFQLKKRRR
jgi:hypothetical protein